jgi:hypothetical protein
MAYQFKPNVKEIIYPPRIQQIADEYKLHGFEYTGPNPEIDMESFKEMGYERRVRGRPDTAYTILYSVYRILDEINNEEYMLWKEIKYVKDRDEKDYHVDIVMGKRPRFDVVPITDEEGNEVDKRIGRWNMVYTTKWDPKKFEELIAKSKTKRTACYIAYTSPDYYTNYTGTPIRIKDLELYKTMTFSELIKYDKGLELENKLQKLKTGK